MVSKKGENGAKPRKKRAKTDDKAPISQKTDTLQGEKIPLPGHRDITPVQKYGQPIVQPPDAEKPDAPPATPQWMKAGYIREHAHQIKEDAQWLQIDIPAELAHKRTIRAKALATETLQLIISEATEELLQQPDLPMLSYELNSMAEDVLALVLNSLAHAGWKVWFDGEHTLYMELPLITPVATFGLTQRSIVKPL